MKSKKIVVEVLAHVDAGKTTLSEAMLYESGSIRSLGRVDNKDAFLEMLDGAIGIKTGFTGNAGYCFAGAIKKDGKTVLFCCV